MKATLDGEITSYFEWLGAGVYRLDQRTGAMHGQRFFVSDLLYGSEGQNLYLRLDFVEGADLGGPDTELRIAVHAPHSGDQPAVRSVPLTGSAEGVESVCGKVCEVKLSLSSLGIPFGHDIRFQLSLWQAGLPMEALPPQGWIELSTAEPTDMMI